MRSGSSATSEVTYARVRLLLNSSSNVYGYSYLDHAEPLLRDLLGSIRDRVRGGLPYLGSSAGSMIACPTIRTTNDMPIVQPPSFDSHGLVPFQLNCHYLDPDPSSTHMGETREVRIGEFHEE